VIELGASHGVRLGEKTTNVAPGVDTTVFAPRAERSMLLPKYCAEADAASDEIGVFAGRLLWTKGLHYLIAAMPLILARHPRFRLLVAGEGPMLEPLRELIKAIGQGRLDDARDLLSREERLGEAPDYGAVLPDFSRVSDEDYRKNAKVLPDRIHFLGHLGHSQLAELFAVADISFAPSVFPEAFGLVSIEALGAGAIPVATYQSGLRTPVDAVHGLLNEPALKELVPGVRLTEELARVAQVILEKYPTRDMSFRRSLHKLTEQRFSWAVVVEQMMRLVAAGV
jgi:glycosyltransferase involved in cell wall biosynthesis